VLTQCGLTCRVSLHGSPTPLAHHKLWSFHVDIPVVLLMWDRSFLWAHFRLSSGFLLVAMVSIILHSFQVCLVMVFIYACM